MGRGHRAEFGEHISADRVRALDSLAESVGLHLAEANRDWVLDQACLECPGAGEAIVGENAPPKEVMLLFFRHSQPRPRDRRRPGSVRTATAREFLSQSALTREVSQSRATVSSVCAVLVLPLKTINALIKASPLLAMGIGQPMELSKQVLAQPKA